MENVSKWHYRAPNKEEEAQARIEIEALLAKSEMLLSRVYIV